MPSFGELQIQIDGRLAGAIHVESLRPLPALHPRLGIDLRVTLQPLENAERYALTDIAGELRLDEGSSVIGQLCWYGPWPHVPPQPHASEVTLTLACDLQHGVLDRIEAQRSGEPPRFWIELWPRLELEGGGFLRSWTRGSALAVPREQWLRVLEGIGYGRYDWIEVRIPVEHGDAVRAATDALRVAQKQLERGNWDETMASVRYVCEALKQATRQDVRAFLKERLGKHGEHWARTFSDLKDLTAIPHHHFGQGTRMRRAEARGSVRSAATMLELVSELLAEGAAESNGGPPSPSSQTLT